MILLNSDISVQSLAILIAPFQANQYTLINIQQSPYFIRQFPPYLQPIKKLSADVIIVCVCVCVCVWCFAQKSSLRMRAYFNL